MRRAADAGEPLAVDAAHRAPGQVVERHLIRLARLARPQEQPAVAAPVGLDLHVDLDVAVLPSVSRMPPRPRGLCVPTMIPWTTRYSGVVPWWLVRLTCQPVRSFPLKIGVKPSGIFGPSSTGGT